MPSPEILLKRIAFAALLLASASACASIAPGRAPAPRADAISRAEIQASGAADAHDLVQRLRADWLIAGGQPAADEVLVFVDGRLLGNVRALRGLSLERVDGLQLHSPHYAREIFRFPHREFEAAIALTTFTQPEQAHYRVAVTVGAGKSVRSLSHQLKNAADELGFTHNPPANWENRGQEMPATLHVGARYGLRPRLWLAADVEHTPDAWYGGYLYRPEDGGSGLMSASAASTELAVQLSMGEMVRATVGPAVRMVRWDWRTGECACEKLQSGTTTSLGLAAAVEAAVPRSSKFFLDVALRGRWYPSQNAGPYHGFESIEVGGLTVAPTIGIGARF